MMGNYGPSDIGSFDWYKANTAMGAGDLGMVLHTPVAVGVWEQEQLDRTEWIPPVPGPDGAQVAAPWTWGLGISAFSSNPGAAWLFLQWATSRPAILLQNTQQWQEQPTYGPARSNWMFDQEEYKQNGLKESWQTAHTEGMAAVPSDPPPVPLDTPQNMDIMSNAAIAMNSAVTGTKSAQKALSDVAPEITELAKEIPDAYLE
jgi:multiple sugar transport system substrate-binding protein